MQQQGFSNLEHKNGDDLAKSALNEETEGLTNWNKAQPDQDYKSNEKESESGSNQKTRPLSKWSTSGTSGVIMSTLGICGTFVILCLLIGLMVFHFGKKDVRLTSMSGGLNYMALNLNSDPIMQLSLASNDCPVGTEKVHLGAWPGVDAGCKCPIGGVKRGSCSNKQKVTCTDVPAIEPIDMFKWESSVFCAKRAKLGTDYIKTASCPSGYKECSSSLCFVETLSCPITSIFFSNTGDSITSSNTQGVAPIINLEVSLNNVPCFSNTEVPQGKGDYQLLTSRPEGCLAYGPDTEYSFKIDEMTENNLLINNNFPSNVFQLPDYQEVLNETPTILSGRRRITVANKNECLAIETNTFNNAAASAADLNKYVSITVIIAMVLHGVLFIMSFCSIIGIKNNNSWKSIFSGAEAGKWLGSYLFFTFCELIVYIVMIALIKDPRSNLIDSKEYLIELDQIGCFPEGAPRKVIADYDDLVDGVASTLNGLAITLLVLTILTLVPVLSILYYKKYHTNQDASIFRKKGL